jgi:hypothetical protein
MVSNDNHVLRFRYNLLERGSSQIGGLQGAYLE